MSTDEDDDHEHALLSGDGDEIAAVAPVVVRVAGALTFGCSAPLAAFVGVLATLGAMGSYRGVSWYALAWGLTHLGAAGVGFASGQALGFRASLVPALGALGLVVLFAFDLVAPILALAADGDTETLMRQLPCLGLSALLVLPLGFVVLLAVPACLGADLRRIRDGSFISP